MRKPSNKMGVAPRFRDYTGTDAAGFVASENVARRHMSISQLALAGAKLADVEMARAKARQLQSLKRGDELPSDPDGSDGDAGRTAQIVADKIGIGRTTVNRGIKVVKAGAPEVVKAVESNGMSSARILPLAAQGLKVRDVSSMRQIISKTVSDDFREWLLDRRNRRKIPHRLESAGYVPVRNDGADDGLWKLDGKRTAVYARHDLPLRDRIAAAQRLSRR